MSGYGSGYYGSGLYGIGEGNTMPSPPTVQGYTGLTQQTRLCLENNGSGEQLLLAQTAGASTMSLTTQPNTLSPTTGMHLHFYVIGNQTAGSIVITGTNASGGAQTSITYHVPIAPQNGAGYTEFTTKETWATVTASNIALTTLTPCTIMVFGSWGAKYLLPISIDQEEKITHHAPQDKRGILFKNFRVVQLTKAVDVSKLDCDLYPDSLWAYYMAIGNVPTVTTVPSSPTTLLASTSIASPMTLSSGPSAPGQFLIFTITSNTASGTIVVGGTDQFGNAYSSSETITFTSAASQTVYSSRRYSAVNTGGTNKFTTTGGTGSSIAVTGVYAWQYAWTFDGINNLTPYAATMEVYNGVNGVILPGTILTDASWTYEKEKEILLQTKGSAQDYLVVGDPASTTVGTNPFATLSQPTSLPYTSWPATFFIDNGLGGSALTTQDGTLLKFKLDIMTGRKWNYAGDGMQRPAYITWDNPPDFSVDADIIYINYQNYINYFKPNAPMILGAQFQGTLLGSISSTVYYEQVQFITPVKIDTIKVDQTKSPITGTLKLMAQYDQQNLGYGYKVIVIAQQPPVYTA